MDAANTPAAHPAPAANPAAAPQPGARLEAGGSPALAPGGPRAGAFPIAGDLLVLDPLADLLEGPAPRVTGLEGKASNGASMPEPYRRLLVHPNDMTSTLEAFHREASRLEVLERRILPGSLLRKVLLRGKTSDRVQEFGAIRIELNRFERPVRREILQGGRPLGALLAEFRVAYSCRPQDFFAIEAAGELLDRLGPPATAEGLFYGRRNLLVGREGTLAEVVEILPRAPAR